jgi:hypothetical protein
MMFKLGSTNTLGILALPGCIAMVIAGSAMAKTVQKAKAPQTTQSPQAKKPAPINTLPQSPQSYKVEIPSDYKVRDPLIYVADNVPGTWDDLQISMVRMSIDSPNPIGFVGARSMRGGQTGIDSILVKEKGKWRVVWSIRYETNGSSTCKQVMDHMAAGHNIAKNYGVDPDLFSGAFINWEAENKAAIRSGGKGCRGSVIN